MPYTFGDAQVPVDHVDLAIEVDAPLVTHSGGTPDDDSATIGERVASMVLDGSTMQLGIGAVPDATLALIGRSPHTHACGPRCSPTASSPSTRREPSIETTHSSRRSSSSSQDLYDWIDGNSWVRMLRTEKTNDRASSPSSAG